MRRIRLSPATAPALAAAAVVGLSFIPAFAQVQGPSSSQTPYVVPVAPGVITQSLMTVGDSQNAKAGQPGVPYRAVGIMDGLGAFNDAGGQTFTLLMNHELPVGIANGTTPAGVTAGTAVPTGVTRAHGNAGSFVSHWTIDRATRQVVEVQDFNQNAGSIFLSNNAPGTSGHSGYLPGGTTLISRLCSADLAAPGAYQFTDALGTTYGTPARIFQSGEESSGVATIAPAGGSFGPESRVDFGRQFAFVATDDPNTPAVNEARTTYELPHAGLFSWENNLASPFAQRKTVVMGMDDSTGGQVYVWVGDKQTTGNVVERAGLTRQGADDNLYVVNVAAATGTISGNPGPSEERATPLGGTFTLQNEGDVSGKTFGELEATSDSLGGTQFQRPEDGQWDPLTPNRYWFTTTDRVDEFKDNLDSTDTGTAVDQVGRSRLYRMDFTDIGNPTAGGTITAALDGTEAHQMLDNMTSVEGVDGVTRLLLQEDPGNYGRSAKIWLYDPSTDALTLVAQHDTARFGDVGDADLAGELTRDEESSGIIDARDQLGLGWFLLDVQAHFNPGDPELVEGGQLVAMFIPQAVPEPGTLSVLALGAGLLAARRRRGPSATRR